MKYYAWIESSSTFSIFSLDEIESFINHIEHEAPTMTQQVELPQLKYKLLHCKDKIERKRQLVPHVIKLVFSLSPTLRQSKLE